MIRDDAEGQDPSIPGSPSSGDSEALQTLQETVRLNSELLRSLQERQEHPKEAKKGWGFGLGIFAVGLILGLMAGGFFGGPLSELLGIGGLFEGETKALPSAERVELEEKLLDVTKTHRASILELETEIKSLDSKRQELKGQLRSQVAISNHLQTQLESKSEALDDALSRIGKPEEQGSESDSEDGVAEGEDVDPVRDGIDRINEAFDRAGILTLELLHVEDVGVEALIGTAWAVFNDRGQAIGSIHADTANLEFMPEAGTALLTLKDGSESLGGEQTPFPNDVLKKSFASVKTAEWRWDSLADAMLDTGDEVESSEEEATPEDMGSITTKLQDLLFPHGYELVKVGTLGEGSFKDVRVDAPQPGGRGRQAIRAKSLRVNFVRSGSYLELIFDQGTVEDAGGRRPFFNDRMRVPLPQAEVKLWKEELDDLIHERG